MNDQERTRISLAVSRMWADLQAMTDIPANIEARSLQLAYVDEEKHHDLKVQASELQAALGALSDAVSALEGLL